MSLPRQSAHSMGKYLAPKVEVLASSHASPTSGTRTAGAEPAFRGSDPFGKGQPMVREPTRQPRRLDHPRLSSEQ